MLRLYREDNRRRMLRRWLSGNGHLPDPEEKILRVWGMRFPGIPEIRHGFLLETSRGSVWTATALGPSSIRVYLQHDSLDAGRDHLRAWGRRVIRQWNRDHPNQKVHLPRKPRPSKGYGTRSPAPGTG